MALDGAGASGGRGVEGGRRGERHLPVTQENSHLFAALNEGLRGAITGWEWALIAVAQPEVRRGPRACRM